MQYLRADRLPAIFGGGILAIALVWVVAATLGMTVPIVLEGFSAAVGMVAGARLS